MIKYAGRATRSRISWEMVRLLRMYPRVVMCVRRYDRKGGFTMCDDNSKLPK